MAWEFNAFAGTLPGSDATRLIFAAGPHMPAGYEVHIVGSGLSFDAGTGALSGTITSYELVDPAFPDNGGVRQSISVAAADQATLAASIQSFLQEGLGMVDDTFGPAGIVPSALGFDHLGQGEFDPSGSFVKLELKDASDATVGYLRANGTDLTDATFSTIGSINSFDLLDTDGTTVLDNIAYGTAKKASAFEYGMQSVAEALGNGEAIFSVLVQGDNTITKFDAIEEGYNDIDGGAGNDHFESTSTNGGGFIHYNFATAGVTADLSAGEASGGAGNDTWSPADFGGLGGSNFSDNLTGNTTNTSLRGEAGHDTITGKALNDIIDAGAGADTVNAGNGNDWVFAGQDGDADTVHGGLQDGSHNGDPEDATGDLLIYSHVKSLPDWAGLGLLDVGTEAANFAGGITVTYTGTGSGSATGTDIGTDTFDGIENVLGSKNSDTFNASGAGAGATNIFTGMAGGDTFTGGAGRDIVNYDNEVFDATIIEQAIAGTFNHGVLVNMSATGQTVGGIIVAAGKAIDSFDDLDTLTNIDDLYGTSFADALIGNGLDNTLVGKEGTDLFAGGAGNDIIWAGTLGSRHGGSAADYVDYRRDGASAGITVTANLALENLSVVDTHGDTDTVYGNINIVGTDANDSFLGDARTNRFSGGRGDDDYTSGGGGGAPGGDQVSYLFEDNATLGIDFDATRLAGQIVTNDGVDTYWGTDTLFGYSSIWLEATQNDDILVAGGGDDVLLASHGTDSINGGAGTDAIAYVDFRTTLRGVGVTITADTATSGEVLDANGGTDTYTNVEALGGSMQADTFNGSTGDDYLMGFSGDDTFNGNGGSDTVSYAYDSVIAFGLGVQLEQLSLDGDSIHGIVADLGLGTVTGVFHNLTTDLGDSDTLVGINNIVGSMWDDDITGNASANRIDGGLGVDVMRGLGGNDTYVVDSAADVVVDTGGTDKIESFVTKTLASTIENLTLLGTAGLSGTGNSLANTLVGNSGINRLTGANGRDTLTGGGARDIFDFNSVTEMGKTASTRDKITDFQHNVDDIDLSTIDANGSAAGNGKFVFLAAKGAAFTGVKGQLHWFQTNAAGTANDKTIIEGDINGDKKADFHIELTGLKVLTASDFIL